MQNGNFNKIDGRFRVMAVLASCLFSVTCARGADIAADSPEPADNLITKPTLYCVGYSHLDTQWRWSYPQVISEFLHNTLQDNFKLFEKYPHYVFNFTGANRYMMFKEYYPQDYEKLKQYIAQGRWFPAGSSMEEGDVNMPDGETIIRQILYGNKFFHREFGKQSQEYMLPDCFGFQASLPSILVHCGLSGFSTQKLTWGSAVGIPFNVGVWEGPDGKGIVAALNPTSYGSTIDEDLTNSAFWEKRIAQDASGGGAPVDYRYYGTGDRGGSPGESSVKWLEKSVTSDGPVKVVSAKSDQMFLDLTPAQIAKLPRYKGDLLLTGHSTGELTSEAFMKRCERKIEQLADAAERSSVAAEWLGGAVYPMQKINAAWTLALGAQFHDTMAGTALPKSYDYSWNNEVLSLNQFAAATEDACGAVVRALDTRVQGVPVVVYNPLTTNREDIAEATITVPPDTSDTLSVFGPDGHAVPSQLVSKSGNQRTILFLAKCQSVGFAVYDVRTSNVPVDSQLKVTDSSLENERFRVTLNGDGDIASIYDKANQHEVLSAPARLEFLHENPEQWPAWNMDYADRMAPPRGYVTGPCKIRVVENGPARVALEVQREAEGSKFTQQIRLSAGSAGDRVEVLSKIDWRTKESSLEAVFPLTVSNPLATYESQSAAVQRGNNEPKKFEVPQQQWFDVTDVSGQAGTAILNDSKYGSDKPNDKTVRLTLLYTPGTRGGYQDQGSQDLGRHEILYALAPHAGEWQKAGVPAQAERLNQPLLTFQSTAHPGTLGQSFSLCQISDTRITATAIKKAEDSDEIIIRLHELTGQTVKGVRVRFAGPVQSVREVDGQERQIGTGVSQDGILVTDMIPFGLRAFAVTIAKPAIQLTATTAKPLTLAYNLDAASSHDNLKDGTFDDQGCTYAAEGLPSQIVSEGIPFTIGPTADGQNNAVACRGQTLSIPAGQFNRVYVLASAVDGDQTASFLIDGKPQKLIVQDWSAAIGEWDTRLWRGVVPGLTYDFKNRLAGLKPGFIKRDTVAWFLSHRHNPDSGNEYYKFSYLFKYRLDLPAGATIVTLPDNNKIRVFAVTAAHNENDDTVPARALYDTLADHVAGGAPVISPPGGSFKGYTAVTIAPPLYYTVGGLHYTLDGSEPTASSPVYSDPLQLSGSATVRAAEIDDPAAAAQSVSAVFTIDDSAPPKVTAVNGIAGAPSITLNFSKPVNKQQAEDPAHYQLNHPTKIISVELSDDGLHATLALDQPIIDSDIELTASGITDRSPRAGSIVQSSIALAINRPVAAVDSFDANGDGLEKRIERLPIEPGAAWTMNLYVKSDTQPEDRTIIAGFGRDSDSGPEGSGRYLSKFSSGIHFWSRHSDVNTNEQFELNRWQMLTITYDGTTLKLYKDGRLLAINEVALANDEPVIRLAPLDPWDNRRRFTGSIRKFAIWRGAFPADTIKAFAASLEQMN